MQEQVFKGSNRNGIGAVFIGLAIAVGIPFLSNSAIVDWLAIGLGGFLFLLGLLQVLSPFRLILREDGFETTAVYRTTFYAWTQVSELTAVHIGGREVVAFDVTAEDVANAQSRLQVRAMVGHEIFIPPLPNTPARKLAELMNECREQALNRS